VAPEVRGNQQPADYEARHDVASDDLQIGEAAALLRARVRRVGERWNADERQRARFGGDDRQADHHPRRVAAAEKIVFDGSMRGTKAAAEDRDAGEVHGEDGVVEAGEAHPPHIITELWRRHSERVAGIGGHANSTHAAGSLTRATDAYRRIKR